jgi:hypothetical protein
MALSQSGAKAQPRTSTCRARVAQAELWATCQLLGSRDLKAMRGLIRSVADVLQRAESTSVSDRCDMSRRRLGAPA